MSCVDLLNMVSLQGTKSNRWQYIRITILKLTPPRVRKMWGRSKPLVGEDMFRIICFRHLFYGRWIVTLGWRRYVQNNLFSSFVFYILQSRIEIKQSLDLSVVYSEGRRKPWLIVKYNTAAILLVILSIDFKSSNFLLQQNNLKVKFIFPSTFSLKFY